MSSFLIHKDCLKLPSNRSFLKLLEENHNKEFWVNEVLIPIFIAKIEGKDHFYLEVSYFVKKYSNPWSWKLNNQTEFEEYPNGPLWDACLDLIFPNYDQPTRVVSPIFAPYLYVNLFGWSPSSENVKDLIFYIYPEKYSVGEHYNMNKPSFYFVHINIAHFFFLYYTSSLALEQFLSWKINVASMKRNQKLLYR